MATQIHTYCRSCREPVPVTGLSKQEVTCASCGASFTFADDGPLYLAPPPGVDPEGFAYEARLKDGRTIAMAVEMPPPPGESDEVDIVGVGQSPEDEADPEGHYHCPVCRWILAPPGPDDPRECISCNHRRTVDSTEPVVPATRAEMQSIRDAEAYRDAMNERAFDIVTARIDRGEPMTQLEVIEAVNALRLMAEEQIDRACRGEPLSAPPIESLLDPQPEIETLERDPRWSDAEYEARQASFRDLQERAARGEEIDPETVARDMAARLDAAVGSSETWRPEQHAAAPAPAAPSAPGAGWIVFAVGFVALALAFPIGVAIGKWSDLVGTGLAILLGIWGVSGLYKGLREALGFEGRPVVTGVLTFVAANACVMAGLGLMGAIGLGLGAPPDSVAEAPSNVSG